MKILKRLSTSLYWLRSDREMGRGISLKGNMLSICVIISVIVGTIAVVAVGKASPMPVISVDPPIITAEVGEDFTVDIVVVDTTEEESLYGWEFHMSFDPNILECTEVLEGPFLSDIASTSWNMMAPEINNTAGIISAADTFLPPYPAEGATGNGVLCTITFQVKTEGKTDLQFLEEDPRVTKLRTYTGVSLSPIDHTAVDGIFAYPLSRDIAVTSVAASPASVPPGETVSINVTVENQGNVPETFNVTTYYDSAVIDTTMNVFLEDGADTTLTFTWDATGVAAGSYTIKAEASPLPEEDDPIDNVYYADQKVTVELVHDIALIEVAPSSTSVPAGELVSINVTVKNEGSAAETFDVTILYDSTDIEIKTVTDLVPGDSETLSFSWNTKDAVEGNYTITAVASGIDGETDTTDNTLTSVVVTVTAPLGGFPTPLAIAIIIAIVTMFSVVLLYTRRRRSTKA